jgi:carboxylate-amine ligase
MEFRAGPLPSVGVEYELQLLDAHTLDLTDGILPLLGELGPSPYIRSEYNQYTVEVASRPFATVAELHAHLLDQVRLIHQACSRLGMKLASAGTHPFCNHLAPVTPEPRYREVEADTGYAGYTQIVFATHVHVGVGSGPAAIELIRRLRPYLYLLTAVSASSPFFWGFDTGFASFRLRELLEAHAYGTAPMLESWEAFEQLWRVAQHARIFKTFKDNHWDIRPKPEFGTVEVRSMDAQPTVGKTLSLVALVQSLADYLSTRPQHTLPSLPLWLERENRYRCSHLGMEAQYVISPDGETQPVRDLAVSLLEQLAPIGLKLGARGYLDGIGELITRPCYQRQREIYHSTGSLRTLTLELARELDQEVAARARPSERSQGYKNAVSNSVS